MTHKVLKREINGLFGRSNECNLQIFNKLDFIKQNENWKKKSWRADEFVKLSFNKYITQGLGISSYTWFKNIEQILKLKNGRELYHKYGHANMVTYLRSTENEREAILRERELKNLKSPFSKIKSELFGATKREQKTESYWRHEAIKWKKKYEDLKNRLQKIA
jgi:ERCC4-related helicase